MIFFSFSKNVIAWFKSYLRQRKFKANTKTSYCSPARLICGILQGSILALLLFLLYINDFPRAVVSHSLLYADDTSIVFLHKKINEIKKQLLRDVSSLCDWFFDNKLNIHFSQDKAKSIFFGTKHKLRNAEALNTVYNGTEIKQYTKVKRLGCILDQSLSGELVNQWL